jgi:hypothetical protein
VEGKWGCGGRVDRVRLALIPLVGLGATMASLIHMPWVPCSTWQHLLGLGDLEVDIFAYVAW